MVAVTARKFSTFRPASGLHPDGGRNTVQYLHLLLENE